MKCVVRSAMLIAALAALAAAPLAAQQPAAAAAGRIAFVNARALLSGMPGYAKAESTFTKELEAGRAEVQQAAGPARLAPWPSSSSSRRCSRPPTAPPSGRSWRPRTSRLQQRRPEIQQRLAQRERELLAADAGAAHRGHRRHPGRGQLRHDHRPRAPRDNGIVTYDKTLDITQRASPSGSERP